MGIDKLSWWRKFCCSRGWHKWIKDIRPIYANYSSMVCGNNWDCKECKAHGESYGRNGIIKTKESPFWD